MVTFYFEVDFELKWLISIRRVLGHGFPHEDDHSLLCIFEVATIFFSFKVLEMRVKKRGERNSECYGVIKFVGKNLYFFFFFNYVVFFFGFSIILC